MTGPVQRRVRDGAYGAVINVKDYLYADEISVTWAGHGHSSVAVDAGELSVQVFEAGFARRLAEAFTQAARMLQEAGQ